MTDDDDDDDDEFYFESNFIYIPRCNPLNAELNPICRLLALLGAHLIFHFSGLRVKGCNEKYFLLHFLLLYQ